MNSILAKCVLLVSLVPVALAEDITTIAGKSYAGVTIIAVEPDGLKVETADGIEKIPFRELSEEVQKKHGFDAQRAAQFSVAVRQAAMQRQQTAAQATAAQRAALEQPAPPLVSNPDVIAALPSTATIAGQATIHGHLDGLKDRLVNAGPYVGQKFTVFGRVKEKVDGGVVVKCMDTGTRGHKKWEGPLLLIKYPRPLELGDLVECTATGHGTYLYGYNKVEVPALVFWGK